MADTNFGGSLGVNGPVFPRSVPATEATAGAVTFTTQQVLGGLILRDPNGASRSDFLPTAADLMAAMRGLGANDVPVGASLDFVIRNTADAAETITVTTNTGLTLSGTMTIAQNNSKLFRAVVTAAGAVTVYSIGTFVH